MHSVQLIYVARLYGVLTCSACRRKPVSGEEGHSTILLAHTRIFTRMILILTEAHDYEAMGF